MPPRPQGERLEPETQGVSTVFVCDDGSVFNIYTDGALQESCD